MAGGSSSAGVPSGNLSPEEKEFLTALNDDLKRFNSFFIDKEEDAVIKLQVGLGSSSTIMSLLVGLHTGLPPFLLPPAHPWIPPSWLGYFLTTDPLFFPSSPYPPNPYHLLTPRSSPSWLS